MHNNRLYEQARFYLERSNLLESQLNETSEITEAILDELLNTLEDQVNFYSSLVEMRDYTSKERLADTPEGEALRTKLTKRAERIRGLADRFNKGQLKYHGSDSDDPSKRREGGVLAGDRLSWMMRRLGDATWQTSQHARTGQIAVRKLDTDTFDSETVTSKTPMDLHTTERGPEWMDPDEDREYSKQTMRGLRSDARTLGAQVKADKQKTKIRRQLQVPGAVGKHAHEHVRDPESFGGLDAGEKSKDSRFSP